MGKDGFGWAMQLAWYSPDGNVQRVTGQEDEEGEYEAWKGREMGRIARDREEKRREAAEAELRERLKHMTDDERRQWERSNPKVTHCFNLGRSFLATHEVLTIHPFNGEAAHR